MVDMPAIRKRVGSLTLGLAIFALLALLCLIASILFATRFVEDTIKFAVDNIATRSGLSVYLVRGVVIFATIPFFWAVGKFTKNIWGLINLGWDSMALYKNWYGRIIVGYVGVYFLVIYWASLQALDFKYCAETPEGTWTSDSTGKDPVYGIELKPCTMEQKLALREGTGHLKPPSELTITDAENFKWFDPVTGRPLVWYSALPNHGFHFFDSRGIDPHNGQELKPVTSEVVERIRQQQASEAMARRRAEESAAETKSREENERAAAVQRAQTQEQIEMLTQKAQAAFDAGDYKTAFETCVQVLKASNGDKTCRAIREHSGVKMAQQLVNEGQAYFEKGEFDEAVWSADKALEFDPANQNAVKLKRLSLQMKPKSLQ
jgi:hypothetical protein